MKSPVCHVCYYKYIYIYICRYILLCISNFIYIAYICCDKLNIYMQTRQISRAKISLHAMKLDFFYIIFENIYNYEYIICNSMD